jgi:hypothetical protein
MPFKYKIILLVLLAVFTRFIGLNWGNNYYFHPDENNMATALSELSLNSLNPHFFAYGQFPLYLGFFSLKAIGQGNDFSNSILILRFYSALFSIISLYFFYKIYPNLKFILLLIFTPGLIQLSHFGTTESLLILSFAINLYLAKLILQKPKLKYFFYASIVSGIAMATKISGAIFVLPIIFAAIISRSWLVIPFGFISLLLGIILSPYNLISYPDFISAMKYETSVATGTLPVFYTTQFQNSLPYLFQLLKIFPYANSWPIFLFGLLSLFFIKIKEKKYFMIVFFSSLIYFLYFGQLYVKWTRFMSPIFFVMPLLATLFLKKFPKLFPLAIVSGIIFTLHYFSPDIRVQASNYLVTTLAKNSTILSESGNVVNLPVLPSSFKINNYDFYNYNSKTLAQNLINADYIIVPSRRVFKNYNYEYYQNLFNGQLGFQEIKTFSPWSDFFLNSENAEETWSVFDRPTIRIYQKTNHLTLSQYENLL